MKVYKHSQRKWNENFMKRDRGRLVPFSHYGGSDFVLKYKSEINSLDHFLNEIQQSICGISFLKYLNC